MKMKYLIGLTALSVTAAVPAVAQDMHPSTGTPHAGGQMPTGSNGGANGSMQNTPSHGDEGGAGPGGMNTHSVDHGAGMQNGDQVVPHHAMESRGMDDRGMGGDHRGGMQRGGYCRTVWHNHHRVRRCM